MSEVNIPRNDGELNVFLAEFADAMVKYQVALGYEPGDVQACQEAKSGFSTALTGVNEAKRNLKAKTTDKKEARTGSVKTVRDYAQRIKNNPAATNEIKNAFGINTNPSGSGVVTAPTDTSAEANSDGTAKVKWNRNGNAPKTVFLIETKTTGNWMLYATTTKVTYIDPNAAPGVEKSYRVRAQRGNVTSAPSGTATIYPTSGDGELTLAA